MAASPHRVLFYTLSGDTGPAQSILDEWGVAEQIELVGVRHDVLVPVTTGAARELARGCEAVVNEFAGLDEAGADALAASGVRLLASLSIGINHFDVDALTRAGVLLTNCPGYCADDVALHAVALMLDLMRKVTASNIDVRAGRWNPYFGYPVHRPAGRTLGLVFFGRIARKVAPIAQALGMRVVVWAPTKSAEELADAGCEKIDSLDELLVRSDVVSLHCPLTADNEKMINADTLRLMKPEALLINTARGGLIDEAALAEALDEGVIAAAKLDALTLEPMRADCPLYGAKNCGITPHIAWAPIETRVRLLREVAENLRAWIDGTPRNVVNMKRKV
jgi:D-3-phosphoglycerate dehydrogenase